MTPGPWLVIGAAGLVGSHVRGALRDRPTIATYHRTRAPDALRLDVTDRAAVRALIQASRPSVIVLAAGDAYVERCEREPMLTRRVNIEGTSHVAEAARDVGATLVYFSSEYVFDGAKTEYREDDPVSPINEYGRQKVEAERIVGSTDAHLICRISGAYGWEPLGKNFVCQLIDALRVGRRFRVPNDQLITPTPVGDLARAVRDLIERGHVGTWHVAGPTILGRDEFAYAIAEVFGLPRELIDPVPTNELGLMARRPRCGLRDDRLASVLGRRLSAPRTALERMRRTQRV